MPRLHLSKNYKYKYLEKNIEKQIYWDDRIVDNYFSFYKWLLMVCIINNNRI